MNIRQSIKHSILFVVALTLSFSACKKSAFHVTNVNVDFITNIDNYPIFSWTVKSDVPHFLQSACRMQLIDSKGITIWDSGKLMNGEQLQFKYTGNKLQAGEQYALQIKVWDINGKDSPWSLAHYFFTPINYPEDWKAKWISYNYKAVKALPVFKKVIKINEAKKIEYARLYIAAPGFYEAFINGKKLGENVLDPAQTNYEDYTYYTSYDINIADLKEQFVLGIMLGNGWYNQNTVWGKSMIYGQPVFIAQLNIRFTDGSTQIIGTDELWTCKPGPVIFSNIYAGETYNANRLPNDWFNVKSDALWKKAVVAKEHPDALLEQFAEPIRCTDSIDVKQIIAKEDGTYIFDFGQNFTGWAKIKLQGDKGQKITIRCVEELDENGNIDPRTTGFRATKVIQTQTYICSGKGIEVWEPKFTYFGFRYAEVNGLSSPPLKDFMKGMVLNSSLTETGSFSCSEENINKLHDLAYWTLKGNIQGIPTDCPHREKCGWTGDAHALSQALMYNFDAQKFINKYVFDLRSSARNTNKELYFGLHFHDRTIIDKPKGIPTMIVPGRRTSGTASPDWGTAMVQLPWYLYLYYGDINLLSNFYPDMKVWVDYVQAKNEDGLILHGLGDWCPPGGNKNIECPIPVSSTAYHILDLKIMADIAKILGHQSDAEYYADLHKNTIASFNEHFLDKQNQTYGSQTADVMALEIGIAPEDMRREIAGAVVKNIHEKNDGFINTGIFGLSRIFKALSENGFEDEVYRLLSKKGENSFAFMWEQYDATTLWEVLPFTLLDDDELFFRSHNHPMQAGYDAWFYSGIAGINPSSKEPGFKKIIFKPYLTQQLTHAEALYQSGFGTIRSSWKRDGKFFLWNIVIPENSKGEIYLPNYGEKVSVNVNGAEVILDDLSKKFTLLGNYSSGTYQIKMLRL